MRNILVFSIAILLSASKGINGDYYWRDYNNEIPSDAVLGIPGYYIALAVGAGPSNQYALATTRIRPGDTGVYLPLSGSIKIADEIKILCSLNKTGFNWIRTSSATFLIDLEGKRPVYGGVQGYTSGNTNRVLTYIGYIGEYIGKIRVDTLSFSYADAISEYFSNDFYVLTY